MQDHSVLDFYHLFCLELSLVFYAVYAHLKHFLLIFLFSKGQLVALWILIKFTSCWDLPKSCLFCIIHNFSFWQILLKEMVLLVLFLYFEMDLKLYLKRFVHTFRGIFGHFFTNFWFSLTNDIFCQLTLSSPLLHHHH